MEKVKNFLLNVNVPLVIFALIGLRIAVVGAGVGDALAIGAVCAFQGLKLALSSSDKALTQWFEHVKKPDISAELTKELNDIKAHVSGIALKHSMKPPVSVEQSMKKYF